MASKFKYNSDDNIITNSDLQYMTPIHINNYIRYNRYIYGNITKKIKNSTADCKCFDQTVVYTQHNVDKIYTLSKLIDKVGN